jgi:hydrogenase maturation protein HypF
MIERRRVAVRGVVQGVGFRPFVTRLARAMDLVGFVQNLSGEVVVEIEGESQRLDHFLTRVQCDAPRGSDVTDIDQCQVPRRKGSGFEILASEEQRFPQLATSVDLAPCGDCLRELNDPHNRRYQYPFICCAQCGPRFTIIANSPYDRENTAMRTFALCESCRAEFDSDTDRRFHAEGICCPDCGPRLAFHRADGSYSQCSQALDEALSLLANGGILALKGIGGYQLLVAADNQQAVERLRRRKHRPAKPLAVMFLNSNDASRYASVNADEKQALESLAAPIVLLCATGDSLAGSVACGSPWLGAMLPASPLHFLLAQRRCAPTVVTSGNLHGEPMFTDDSEALEGLADIADGFLVHNRDIFNLADDSVVRIASHRLQILRLARGYAPTMLALSGRDEESGLTAGSAILATGGHLKQSPALWVQDRVLCWPQVGDQGTLAAQNAMLSGFRSITRCLGVKAKFLATDMHPDYAPGMWARKDGRPVIAVQHHHAHVAACMAEHGIKSALGIAWDGTGLGADGSLWGSEFLQVTASGYRRLAGLRPFPLPGGDAASRDGRRVLAGLCAEAGLALPDTDKQLCAYARLARSSTSSPLSSSMGRLFDGVAALSGLCQQSQFEAQAAMAVEYAAMAAFAESQGDGVINPYDFSFDGEQLDWGPMLAQMLAEKEQPGRIAARFHATLVAMVLAVVGRSQMHTVALCGGCFQNKLLLESCERALVDAGHRVIFPQRVPPGDGGLALGQAWVAAMTLENVGTRQQEGPCA